MRWLLMTLTGLALGTCLLQSEAQADEKVRIGFPVQIHTANMMVLQEVGAVASITIRIGVVPALTLRWHSLAILRPTSPDVLGSAQSQRLWTPLRYS